MSNGVTSGLPPPLGLIAHIELSKIADYIVSNTYAIAPRESVTSYRDMEDQVKAPLQMLDDWLENLPERLRVPFHSPSEDVYQADGLPHDRALCMLHMKWNQVMSSRLDTYPAVDAYLHHPHPVTNPVLDSF